MSYIERAAQYADNVLSETIPACEYIKNACRRFISDLDRDDIYLDIDDAEKWCRFLEKLPHVKGKWAAKKEKFKLADYQIFCTINIYGWKKTKNDIRRFREVYIEIPRKNGKSFWVSGLGLGHLLIDNEYGAEVYCGATTEKQAWEVFRPAKQICERTPALKERFGLTVNAKTLNLESNGSRFEPMIGDPGDGASPSCGIADEFHEHKTSDQVDTIVTGMGARDQPMMLYITTAGSDMGGPCYSKRDEVIKILDGTVTDDTVFGMIFTIDDGDDWDTIDALRKANPNLGVSVNEDFLLAELDKARRSPTKQTSYKTKHLNQWVGAKSAWLNMLFYQRCKKQNLKLEDFIGRRVIAAFDLASREDFACRAVIVIPEPGEKVRVFCKHYLPEDKILNGGNTRYKAWHAAGWITTTPGNIIDFDYIEEDLKELASTHEVVSVPCDPHQATQFTTHMMDDGFNIMWVNQQVVTLSEPMKQLGADINSGNVEFQNDPVLTWMFANVVAKIDAKDNIYPRKEFPGNKIDGAVAAIIGYRVLIDEVDDNTFSGGLMVV